MTDFKHSSLYIEYSAEINQPNPELLLGPNWKDVLNFWLFLDTLIEDQWKSFKKQYNEMDYKVYRVACHVAKDAAYEVADDDIVECAWDFCELGADYATWELIGSHEILAQNKPLTFLPMFLNL